MQAARCETCTGVQDVLPQLRLNMGSCIKPHVPSPIKLDAVRHRQQAGRSEYPCLFALFLVFNNPYLSAFLRVSPLCPAR